MGSDHLLEEWHEAAREQVDHALVAAERAAAPAVLRAAVVEPAPVAVLVRLRKAPDVAGRLAAAEGGAGITCPEPVARRGEQLGLQRAAADDIPLALEVGQLGFRKGLHYPAGAWRRARRLVGTVGENRRVFFLAMRRRRVVFTNAPLALKLSPAITLRAPRRPTTTTTHPLVLGWLCARVGKATLLHPATNESLSSAAGRQIAIQELWSLAARSTNKATLGRAHLRQGSALLLLPTGSICQG